MHIDSLFPMLLLINSCPTVSHFFTKLDKLFYNYSLIIIMKQSITTYGTVPALTHK